MNKHPIPILQYNLFDVPVMNDVRAVQSIITETIKLVESEAQEFKGIANVIELFHNKDDKYSGIQYASINGSLSVTALGIKQTRVLRNWFRVFKKHHSALKNVQEIKEKYTAEFLTKAQNYHIPVLLVRNDVMKDIRDKKITKEERLTQYIRNNCGTFLKYIGYDPYPEIVVNIDKRTIKQYPNKFTVYKGYKRTGFNVVFTTNLRLPHILRIGQSTSLGYGSVFHIE